MCGTIVYQLSSRFLSIPLPLIPNKTVDISIFRVLPDTLRLELRFTRKSWFEERPELGKYYLASDDWKRTGFLDFPEPGEPIN